MPEAAAGEVIVLHLDDELRRERLPLARPLGAPPAGPTGRLAGEAGRLDQLLELLRDRRLLVVGDVAREAHVMQQAAFIIEAEQERADDLALRRVAESADDALRGAHGLHL